MPTDSTLCCPVLVGAVGRLEPCAGKLACTVLRGGPAGNGGFLPDGKARKPYEFGVKGAVVVSHQHGLMLKSDHRMDRCWLQGALGDALHSISCAAGYNLRWLLRAIARLGIGAVFLRLWQAALSQRRAIGRSYSTLGRVWTASMSNWIGNRVVKKSIFGHAVQGAF